MRRKHIRIAVFALCIAAIAAGLVYGNRHLVTTEYTVQIAALPPAFVGFRIVQLSDLHNAEFGKDNKRLIEQVRRAKPDIIAITGDFVDSRRTDCAVSVALARTLATLCPVYYVTGNHEERLSAQTQKSFYRDLSAAGVTLLHDKAETLTRAGATLSLIGIWESSLWGDTLSTLIEKTPNTVHIVLAHPPHRLRFYAEAKAELVLCGHAHGGQIRLPFLGGLVAPGQGFLPDYTDGVYTRDGTQMVVSRGLGNSIFPLRVFNCPEIVVVNLTDCRERTTDAVFFGR